MNRVRRLGANMAFVWNKNLWRLLPSCWSSRSSSR